jgi:hypothetical protein
MPLENTEGATLFDVIDSAVLIGGKSRANRAPQLALNSLFFNVFINC